MSRNVPRWRLVELPGDNLSGEGAGPEDAEPDGSAGCDRLNARRIGPVFGLESVGRWGASSAWVDDWCLRELGVKDAVFGCTDVWSSVV